MKMIRFPPPSLKVTLICHFVAAIMLVGFAWYTYHIDGSALAPMIDTFLAGFNAAAAFYTNYLIRMRDRFNHMHAMFDSMVQMNGQLIANKFQIIMEGREDEVPTEPRLH